MKEKSEKGYSEVLLFKKLIELISLDTCKRSSSSDERLYGLPSSLFVSVLLNGQTRRHGHFDPTYCKMATI
jgi:hypothetical protein